MEKLFSISPLGVREEQWGKLGVQMRQFIDFVRKFCPNMDVMVLYGDKAMQ
jgi:hypothetical protein